MHAMKCVPDHSIIKSLSSLIHIIILFFYYGLYSTHSIYKKKVWGGRLRGGVNYVLSGLATTVSSLSPSLMNVWRKTRVSTKSFFPSSWTIRGLASKCIAQYLNKGGLVLVAYIVHDWIKLPSIGKVFLMSLNSVRNLHVSPVIKTTNNTTTVKHLLCWGL